MPTLQMRHIHVSGSTMTVNLDQGFEFAMVQALLTERDLKFKLSLAKLPTSDDTLVNSTTVTITEGADNH